MEIPRLPPPPVMLLNVPVIWTPPADWVKVRVPAMPPLLLTIWQAALQSPVILRMNIKLLLATIERCYGVLQLCFGPSRELWTCGGGQFQFPGSRVLSLINRVLGFAQKIEIGFEMLKYNKDDSMSTERAPRKSILRSFVEDS